MGASGDSRRTEGEEWAAAALADLRTGGWSPGAIAAFLSASWRRAALRRSQRPELAAQARRWSAAGAVAWVGGAAVSTRVRAALAPGLAWWALVAVMLDWHLGMFETQEGEPRALGAPDALTLARAWAVPLAARGPHPGLVAAALASDGLDGALARRRGATRAGRDLEGAVDAAFVAAALRGARQQRLVGRLPVVLEGVRLAGGLAYASGMWLGAGRPPSPALRRAARASTPLRFAGLAAAGLGRRRTAGALLGTGSALALIAVARSR